MSFTPPALPALDPGLAARLRARVDGKAKPLGSLGRLEDLAVQIGLIQGTETPRLERIEAYVFAGDHGLNSKGDVCGWYGNTSSFIRSLSGRIKTYSNWHHTVCTGINATHVTAGWYRRSRSGAIGGFIRTP